MDEYGIRHKQSGRIHREKMTAVDAQDWMTDGWDDMDPQAVYEVVCRPVGDWAPVQVWWET